MEYKKYGKNYLTKAPKGTTYEPGDQVKKAKGKSTASSEKIVKNII